MGGLHLNNSPEASASFFISDFSANCFFFPALLVHECVCFVLFYFGSVLFFPLSQKLPSSGPDHSISELCFLFSVFRVLQATSSIWPKHGCLAKSQSPQVLNPLSGDLAVQVASILHLRLLLLDSSPIPRLISISGLILIIRLIIGFILRPFSVCTMDWEKYYPVILP